MLSKLLVILVLVYGSQAGILTDLLNDKTKIDCLVSEWTSWSLPYGIGQISRERVVLRQPMNGGLDCPVEMRQENRTRRLPPLPEVAKQFEASFVTQHTYRKKREEATGRLRDILLIVDSSGSITSSGFSTAKTQLARLMSLLCPLDHTQYSMAHRAALLEYSSDTDIIYEFKDMSTTRGVTQGILNMGYMGGGTATHKAFKVAAEEMFTEESGMRSDPRVKQEVLILTDGQSDCGPCSIDAAKELQKVADVYALVIGHKSDDGIDELTAYVSEPIQNHLFAIDNYQVLEDLLDEIEELVKFVDCAPFDLS